MIDERYSIHCESQKVHDYSAKSVLFRQVICGIMDCGFLKISRLEATLAGACDKDTVVVRNAERVQEVRKHFAAPLYMHFTKQTFGKRVFQLQKLRAPNDLGVLPTADGVLTEVATVGDDPYELPPIFWPSDK